VQRLAQSYTAVVAGGVHEEADRVVASEVKMPYTLFASDTTGSNGIQDI